MLLEQLIGNSYRSDSRAIDDPRSTGLSTRRHHNSKRLVFVTDQLKNRRGQESARPLVLVPKEYYRVDSTPESKQTRRNHPFFNHGASTASHHRLSTARKTVSAGLSSAIC